jgi:serine/threonine-protein kinase
MGVIHRDIKPGNILLTTDGRAKLIDFGLARDTEARTLTFNATCMGTPSYMSPEQAQGKKGTSASDQYSCGIVAFHMIVGKKPFDAKGVVDLLEMQVTAALPPIRALNREVSKELEAVLVRMTAKDPDARYPSALDAAHALRDAACLPASSCQE